jgi:hypothetical protein
MEDVTLASSICSSRWRMTLMPSRLKSLAQFVSADEVEASRRDLMSTAGLCDSDPLAGQVSHGAGSQARDRAVYAAPIMHIM